MGVLGRSVLGRWREGLLAAAILLASPLFFLQSGTYLPYTFQLLLDLAVLVLVLDALRRWPARWFRRRARSSFVCVAAGALWGSRASRVRTTRCCSRYPSWSRSSSRCAVGSRALPGQRDGARSEQSPRSCVLLAYNDALMGGPLRSPFTITGPDDKLGFGTRGVFSTSAFPFTAHDGFTSLRENLVQLPGWTFGGLLLVALALYGLWRQRARVPEVVAIAGLAVTVAVGYAVFWSPYSIVQLWPGARTMGPFYHLALLIPLALFGAAGIGAVVDRSRPLGAVTVVVLVAITAATVGSKIDRNRDINTTSARCNCWCGGPTSAARCSS